VAQTQAADRVSGFVDTVMLATIAGTGDFGAAVGQAWKTAR
jgi:hypothetical protein